MKTPVILFIASFVLSSVSYANTETEKPIPPKQQPTSSAKIASAPKLSDAGVCLSATDEAKIRNFENHALGETHAADHARSRTEHCAVKTPEKQPILSVVTRVLHSINETLSRLTKPALAATGTPAQVGQWSPPVSVPVIGIHTTLMPTGKVLFWTYGTPRNNNNNIGVAYVWNPADGSFRNVGSPSNFWCAGQTLLADGRVLVAGGNLAYGSGTTYARGLNQIYTFNPFTETWRRQPDMRHGRWYPTLTTLADGRVVMTSGLTELGDLGVNPDVEVFTPSSDINGVGTVQVVTGRNITGLYPHQFLLPNGRMILAGPGVGDTAILNPANWTWSDIPNLRQPRYGYGSGVLLPGGTNGSNRVMLIGGSSNQLGVVATTEVFDNANPGAGWQFRASMPQPRRNHNTVLLPDGTMLTVGGNNSIENYTNPLREAQLYNPVTNIWRGLASQVQQRGYHSTAILLPDARVLSAGDDGPSTPGGLRNEIFSPPYLFSSARPTISSAPTQVTWGQTFAVGTPSSVTGAVLIAPGANTHGNNMHQRYVPLTVSATSSGINAIAPPNANVAPPGYYMLFLLNAQGVPSVSRWVRVAAGSAPPPPPSNDPSTLRFSAGTYSVSEAVASVVISVQRDGSTAAAATVNYATSNGSATAGSDYTTANGTLNFAAGQNLQTFSVPITDDTAAEGNETINLALSVPGGATLGTPATAVLTITDNDTSGGGGTTTATVSFNSSGFGGPEGTAPVITVYRATSSVGAFSVNYATSNGTATAGNDYTAASGTLSWASGEVGSKTFTVPLLSDGISEPKETINMTLSNPTNGATITPNGTAVLSIFGN